MDPHCNQHRLFNSPKLGLHGQTNKGLSMETKKQRRERAFTLAWKRAIRSLLLSGDPYESRTRVCGVRGRRLNHLTNGPSSSQSPLHFLQTPVCRPLRSLAPPLPSKPASLGFTWVPKGTLCAPSKLNNVIRKQPAIFSL